MVRSILYIDDEEKCLDVFKETFGGGNDVRTTTTPAEGLRMLEERPADIIISDETMPGTMGGANFLKEVARTHPTSYRVLLTGSIGFAHVMREIGEGDIHFFAPKPWAQEDMLKLLARANAHFRIAEAKTA